MRTPTTTTARSGTNWPTGEANDGAAVTSGPPAWDWEGRFGEDKASVFQSGLAFEDALIIFITLMAREEEKLALEATEALAAKTPKNLGAVSDGDPSDTRDQEVIAMDIKNHLERKGNLLLLANSIMDSFNQTLDRVIQSIGQA